MTTALSIILALCLIAWIILSFLMASKKNKQTKLLIVQLQKLNKHLEENRLKRLRPTIYPQPIKRLSNKGLRAVRQGAEALLALNRAHTP